MKSLIFSSDMPVASIPRFASMFFRFTVQFVRGVWFMISITIEKRETRKGKEKFEMNRYGVSITREIENWQDLDATMKDTEARIRDSQHRMKTRDNDEDK